MCACLASAVSPVVGSAAEAVFSFASYDRTLKSYVDDSGLVNYRGLKADSRDLDRFLGELAGFDVSSYDRGASVDQIAFWINAYNACTLKAIVDHFPIKPSIVRSFRYPQNSIRQIAGVWDRLTFTVMGRQVTLDEIEHDTLRKRFNEPRIHMALVCAAMGCPPLRNQPFQGSQLAAQLDDQTRRFLGDPGKFRIDRTESAVYLSPIFKWFGADFVKTYGPPAPFPHLGEVDSAVLAFIGRYVSLPEREFLERSEYAIQYLDYDWSLNEKKE
jgi:hypothetical protein